METNNTQQLLSDLVTIIEGFIKSDVSEEARQELTSLAEGAAEGTDAFALLTEEVLKKILGENYNSTFGDFVPARLSNGGMLDNEITHQFTKDNACPYFQKSELCALDGRICLYDTETFPVCPKYKEGHTRRIPGVDGREPETIPQSSLPRDPVTQMMGPFNPFRKV